MITFLLAALLTPEAPYEAPYLAAAPEAHYEGLSPRYRDCVAHIAADLEIGRIAAQQWAEEGGGAQAQHCLAIADIAAGFPKLGAGRLETLSARPDAGDEETRARILAQAALAWLDADKSENASRALDGALQYAPELAELQIVAANVHAATQAWQAAADAVTAAEAGRPEKR